MLGFAVIKNKGQVGLLRRFNNGCRIRLSELRKEYNFYQLESLLKEFELDSRDLEFWDGKGSVRFFLYKREENKTYLYLSPRVKILRFIGQDKVIIKVE